MKIIQCMLNTPRGFSTMKVSPVEYKKAYIVSKFFNVESTHVALASGGTGVEDADSDIALVGSDGLNNVEQFICTEVEPT